MGPFRDLFSWSWLYLCSLLINICFPPQITDGRYQRYLIICAPRKLWCSNLSKLPTDFFGILTNKTLTFRKVFMELLLLWSFLEKERSENVLHRCINLFELLLVNLLRPPPRFSTHQQQSPGLSRLVPPFSSLCELFYRLIFFKRKKYF